jgi:hypothetical protein
MNVDKNCHFKGVTNLDKRNVFHSLTQPMTGTQLSRRLGISLDRCRSALYALQSHRLVQCLNPTANRNRLFWLTCHGKSCQRRLDSEAYLSHDFPDIDWGLYASVCYSHRSKVIRTLTFAMQPSQIKRRAVIRTPGLRMSANNVRDVIRYLNAHGIVRQIRVKKRAHPCYQLTEIGLHFRRLLMEAERIR